MLLASTATRLDLLQLYIVKWEDRAEGSQGEGGRVIAEKGGKFQKGDLISKSILML